MLQFIYLKDCAPETLIGQHNYSVYMDRDCSIRFNGCFKIRKFANESKGKVETKFGRMTIPIKSDFCLDATKPRKITGKVLQAVELICPYQPVIK